VLRRQFFATLGAAAAGLRAQTASSRQVVLISIDGFAAYSLKDASIPLPTIRRLAREGAVAEGMQPVNPSVTWPNHTSMVTGVTPARHGVLFNGLPVRGGEGKPLTVEPWVPKSQLVLSPTVYDLAHAAGMTTAEVDWVAIQKPGTITWAFPERPTLEDSIPREMIEAGMVTEPEIRDFAKASIIFRDQVWTQAAEHILNKHRPNLLLYHLLTTDSTQHRYGANSLGGNTALALADARVQRIVDAAGDQTTILIVSDHGFKTYKHVIQPNAMLAGQGLAEDVWVIPEGGSAMVYITRSSKKAELAPRLRKELAAIPGVDRVVEPADFEEYGFPSPNERMADLVLFAADGYSFSGSVKGNTVIDVPAGSTPGSHGYLSTDPDMTAAFVAWGAGIKPGAKLGLFRNIDVAPTIAKLLGLEMNNIQGKVLTAALR
jgi:predicted AlkP superfamily pyrophosphatase or phosphodiesterase